MKQKLMLRNYQNHQDQWNKKKLIKNKLINSSTNGANLVNYKNWTKISIDNKKSTARRVTLSLTQEKFMKKLLDSINKENDVTLKYK